MIWWLIDVNAFSDECTWLDYMWDFVYCAVYAAISLAMSELIHKLLLRKDVTLPRLGLHGLLLTISNIGIVLIFENTFDTYWHVDDAYYWDRIFAFSIIASLLTIMYLCIYYCSIIIDQSKRNVAMQRELLKLQFDPHFVFNSLSTLTELISENQALAETFTLKFSSIYRYIVNQLNKDTVSIAEEIRFIKDYCVLLEIRHPEHFVFEIASGLEQDTSMILPMSLQLLVENAVKHNSHSKRCPLHINIYRSGNFLAVRNKRIPLVGATPATTKIGLKNLYDRYGLLGLHPVVVETRDDFEVRLPMIKK